MSYIALVIPGLDRIGGAERQVILLAKGLSRRGWRVSVVALSGNGGDAAAELAASGAGFLSLKMRKAMVAAGGACPGGRGYAAQLLNRHRRPSIGLSMERLACGSSDCG